MYVLSSSSCPSPLLAAVMCLSLLSSRPRFLHPLFSCPLTPSEELQLPLLGTFMIWEHPAFELQLARSGGGTRHPACFQGCGWGCLHWIPPQGRRSVSASAKPSTISKMSCCISSRAQHFPEAFQLFLYVASLSNSTKPRANIINPHLK